MAKRNIFSATDLDSLINESLESANEFKDELANIEETDDYLDNASKTWSATGSIINSKTGAQVSFDYVYKKIGQLIDNGNAALQLLQSIDPDVTNPATLGATASLLNAIHGCVTEFTKIHQQYIKFQHLVQLEKIKLENKKEMLKFKKKLNEGTLESNVETDIVEVKSTDLLDFYNFKKEQKNNEQNSN